MNRRTVTMAGLAWTIAAARTAAQGPPGSGREIRLVVPAAVGGSADPLARLVAQELAHALRQTVVVDNRPGANGNVGASAAAKAAPDGHTLLLGWTGTLVSAVVLYGSRPFDPQRDFEPIQLLASVPNVIVVSPELPVTTLAELGAYGRKHEGQLNYGSIGHGSSFHIAGERYRKAAGLAMQHVPYAAPANLFTDLIAGRLQLAFPGVPAAAPYVKEGRLRALAVMSDNRSPALPAVPTTVELGSPELRSETWFGLLAPKGTPADVLARLSAALEGAWRLPAVRQKLKALGYAPLDGNAARFASTLAEEIERWRGVVRDIGAKAN